MTKLNSRKAQGLSLETIIIAIIVLLVLVIIGYIFATQIGKTQNKITDCIARGGSCESVCEYPNFAIAATSCDKPGQVCCSKDEIKKTT